MTADAVSIHNAEHYTWGEVCDGWHLLSGAGLSVIEERMPAGGREQRHLHERAQQFFYVLAGELTLELSDETVILRAGEGMAIPVRVPHQASNASALDVRFLVISQPPSHGDRIPA